MKKALCMLLVAAMVLGLAACGGSANGNKANEAKYRVLYGGEVETMNYLTASSTADLKIAYNTVDCLVEYDSYGNVLPALAESWERDGEVWTFHIREGVKWVDHNGKAVADVTANDFVSAAAYALDAANDSTTAYMMTDTLKGAEAYNEYTAYMVQSENGTKTTDSEGNAIEVVPEAKFEDVGVKAINDYTLEYTTDGEKPWFVSALSFGCFHPVYGPFLEEMGDAFGTDNESLLYCGAYYLKEFSPRKSTCTRRTSCTGIRIRCISTRLRRSSAPTLPPLRPKCSNAVRSTKPASAPT